MAVLETALKGRVISFTAGYARIEAQRPERDHVLSIVALHGIRLMKLYDVVPLSIAVKVQEYDILELQEGCDRNFGRYAESLYLPGAVKRLYNISVEDGSHDKHRIS